MPAEIIHRTYPITNIPFREFWDLCGHFQTVFPAFQYVSYTIEGQDGIFILEESNAGLIANKLKNREGRVRRMSARLYTNRGMVNENHRVCEFHFRPRQNNEDVFGLTFYSDALEQSQYFNFEDKLYEEFTFETRDEPEVEFGTPCELLAMVIDIRGFSTFCEQPHIESPYTCGLMSAFYRLIEGAFERFPPNMIKFMGDGVLAVWETNAKSREIIVKLAVETGIHLSGRWRQVCASPHFSHGVPEGTGVGISFGLASHLHVGNDYIGRPINIATRLCGACPSDRIYVDRAVPSLPIQLRKEEMGIVIKPYGRHHVWGFFQADQDSSKTANSPGERRLSPPTESKSRTFLSIRNDPNSYS